MMQGSLNPVRKSGRDFSAEQKREVIRLIEKGETKAAVGREYNEPDSTVRGCRNPKKNRKKSSNEWYERSGESSSGNPEDGIRMVEAPWMTGLQGGGAMYVQPAYSTPAYPQNQHQAITQSGGFMESSPQPSFSWTPAAADAASIRLSTWFNNSDFTPNVFSPHRSYSEEQAINQSQSFIESSPGPSNVWTPAVSSPLPTWFNNVDIGPRVKVSLPERSYSEKQAINPVASSSKARFSGITTAASVPLPTWLNNVDIGPRVKVEVSSPGRSYSEEQAINPIASSSKPRFSGTTTDASVPLPAWYKNVDIGPRIKTKVSSPERNKGPEALDLKNDRVAEVIRHGEKFLELLENCGNPRITRLHTCQVYKIIERIKLIDSKN